MFSGRPALPAIVTTHTLAHLIDHLPQELWDAFLADVVQPRVKACSEWAVLASLLLGLLVRGLFTIHVADPLGLHGQPVYTGIPVSQAAIPDLSCRNLFLQLCRGLPGNGANTRPSAAVAAVLAAHPDLLARLAAIPRYHSDGNMVDHVGKQLETIFSNMLTLLFAGRVKKPPRPPIPYAITPTSKCQARHVFIDAKGLYGMMRDAGMLGATKTWLAQLKPQLNALSHVSSKLGSYRRFADTVQATYDAIIQLYCGKKRVVAGFWSKLIDQAKQRWPDRVLALAAGFSGSGSVGYRGVPISQMLKEALTQFPAGRVLMVDEFRTSRVSSAYSNPSEALPGQPPESFRFYDRDVSAALNIRRCAFGLGPRPTELCYWEGRQTMPKLGQPGQEWVYLRDKALLRYCRVPSQQQPAFHPYTKRLQSLLHQNRPAPCKVVTEGVSGELVVPTMTQRLRAYLQRTQAAGQQFHWVLIFGGTNDLGFNMLCTAVHNIDGQAAKEAAASEPGPSTPPTAKRSNRTKAEQAAELTQLTIGKGKAKGKAAKAKPPPQPIRWLDRDCSAALNMQRIGESSLGQEAETIFNNLQQMYKVCGLKHRGKVTSSAWRDESRQTALCSVTLATPRPGFIDAHPHLCRWHPIVQAAHQHGAKVVAMTCMAPYLPEPSLPEEHGGSWMEYYASLLLCVDRHCTARTALARQRLNTLIRNEVAQQQGGELYLFDCDKVLAPQRLGQQEAARCWSDALHLTVGEGQGGVPLLLPINTSWVRPLRPPIVESCVPAAATRLRGGRGTADHRMATSRAALK
ncbi:hypothetical protein QJQ45_029923 [Haematococcus lacustris]|nr:hypothetical protein QJQ45_029923 [Haematococcus lacustris]